MLTVKDHDIVKEIPDSYGINLEFVDKGIRYKTTYDGPTPRKVMLDITTWKGITPGALHYYGELKVSGLKCKNLETNELSYMKPSGPKAAKGLKISLTRPLIKRDLLIDQGERFKGAKLGERIKNFDTREEVEKAAIKFFNKYFLDGWNLIVLKPVQTMSLEGTTVINDEIVLSANVV